MNRLLTTGIVVLLCMTGVATAAEQPQGKEVLIATQKSDFKSAVVARITEELKKRSVAVRVVAMDELKQHEAETYEAVVMLQSVWAWQLARPVKKFIAKTPENLRSRLVLVCTAGDASWKTKEKGLHAITAASKPDGAAGVADFVVSKIAEIRK